MEVRTPGWSVLRTAMVAFAAGGIALALTYGLRQGDKASRADIPGTVPPPNVTPALGATPNFSEPYWYVPYENAENLAEKFEGEINGIRILSQPTSDYPAEACPKGFTSPGPERVLDLAVSGDLAIQPNSLPHGTIPVNAPELYLCEGRQFEVTWSFDVRPGRSDVGREGTGLDVYRLKGTNEFYRPASEGRWKAVTVAGHRGVMLSPIVEAPGVYVGGCWLAYRDEAKDALTVIWASSAGVEFCTTVGEILR